MGSREHGRRLELQQATRRWRGLTPGKARDFIRPFQVQPGERVVILCRVSARGEARHRNLEGQAVKLKEELAALYRARWNNELDLRSIKVTLQMDMLRCKTPDLVRKEIWTHALAYNLIRTVMAQAAAGEGVPPREISFKAALQVLEAFRPLIAYQAHRGADHRAALYEQLLRAVAVHRVGDRPDRFEPRMAKRRPKRYDRLTRPRAEIKLRMRKRVKKI